MQHKLKSNCNDSVVNGKLSESLKHSNNCTSLDQPRDGHVTSRRSIRVEFEVSHHEIWILHIPASVLIYDLRT